MGTSNIGRPVQKIYLNLDNDTKKQVQKLISDGGDIATKAELLLEMASGQYTRDELAKKTGKTRQELINFMQRFKKHGVPALKKSYIFVKDPVRQLKIDSNVTTKLIDVAKKSPRDLGYGYDNWTLLLLANYLKDHHNVNITRERVRQILKENNTQYFTLRKSAKTN